MRRRRQYGETARVRGDLARRRSNVRDLWRLRIREGKLNRAPKGRGPPLPDRPDLDQPDPRLSRPACAGDAALVLRRSRRTRLKLYQPERGFPRDDAVGAVRVISASGVATERRAQ